MKYQFPFLITGVPKEVIEWLEKITGKKMKVDPPSLIHNTITTVEPLPSPKGEAFFLKYKYGENKK